LTADAAARAVEYLSVIRLEPGDVLVLTCPEEMSPQQGVDLRDHLREAVPAWKDVDVVVLTGGLQLWRMPKR
jgi:hypothetical protein